MQIPFLNLKAQHEPIRAELNAAIGQVIDANAFAGGPFVERFEKKFAPFCDTKHAIGVGNGTDALWLSLLALGVGPGDEVITVPNSFIATAEAISFTGATPVFADVDESIYTMDVRKLEAAITPRTKAIIPVHLYGQPADMHPILELARMRRIPVIEDACQAHGAEYKGRKAGSIGIAGCFSFYPGKNLGAFGEAGAITTNDDVLAANIRVLRDHGQAKKYHHAAIGWNARMDGIQGAVLDVKLNYLRRGNEARRAHAELYNRYLGDVPNIIVPRAAASALHAWHLYVVRVPNRDRVLAAMTEKGVSCAIHYPVPIHLQDCYRGLGRGPGSFPVAEKCANEALSLPMFPELTPVEIARVAETLKSVLT